MLVGRAGSHQISSHNPTLIFMPRKQANKSPPDPIKYIWYFYTTSLFSNQKKDQSSISKSSNCFFSQKTTTTHGVASNHPSFPSFHPSDNGASCIHQASSPKDSNSALFVLTCEGKNGWWTEREKWVCLNLAFGGQVNSFEKIHKTVIIEGYCSNTYN